MSPPSYPSYRPESPGPSPPCLDEDEDERRERVVLQGETLLTPSNTSSSLISSAGSPSDRTHETNPNSRFCTGDLNATATHPLYLTLPTDLLQSLTQTISILWQIRAVGGPANCHRLAHLHHFFPQEPPPRIELPLSHTAYNLLCRLLCLEDFTGAPSWSGNTQALRSASASIVSASKKACISGRHTQHLDLDSEDTSPTPGLSPQKQLVELGRWVFDKLRLEYDYNDSIFVVRMPTFFHDKCSQDIAESLLAYIRLATGDDNVDDFRFSVRSLPLVLDAEGEQNNEGENGGSPGEDESDVDAATLRRSQFHPDAGIFERASLDPGLILELGFSHPTHEKRAKKYILDGKGHIRCVLLLNIDYCPRSQRLSHDFSPPRILLTAFRIDSDEDSWGVKRMYENWDLRAASNDNGQLKLRGDLISEHVDSNVEVSIPLRALVAKIDHAMRLQREVDKRVQGISPAQPSSRDILGKRKRTATPDSSEDPEGSFHPGDGGSSDGSSQS